jgi:hypothetical protein
MTTVRAGEQQLHDMSTTAQPVLPGGMLSMRHMPFCSPRRIVRCPQQTVLAAASSVYCQQNCTTLHLRQCLCSCLS